MSELATRILRALQEHPELDMVGAPYAARLINYEFDSPFDVHSALNELATAGYLVTRPGAIWLVKHMERVQG